MRKLDCKTRKCYKVLSLLMACIFIIMITAQTGCGKNAKESANVSIKTVDTPKSTEVPTISHANEERSMLTGKWIPKEQAANRPLAVMYSNIEDAMPQSSISYADIVFESLVEGGITRLCCVFNNQTSLTKIGPVRSCRTYYLLFAKEFEAIYVHFGASEYAESYLANSVFHSLDGMVYCNFYRSTDRIAPHNAYTSWDGIIESANYRGYELTYPAGYTSPFTFNKDDDNDIVPASGEECKTFYPGYKYNNPWFTYDEVTKTYLRNQFNGPQIDAETGEQLSFKNVLVKYVEPAYYSNGTPNYKIYGTNKGLYITDGRAVPVTWTKASETEGATKYYYDNGEEVVLNQGKTYICQVETRQEVTILAE